MVNKYFTQNANLIGWQGNVSKASNKHIKPCKPITLTHEQWPPDYMGIYKWRMNQLKLLQNDKELLRSAKAYYKNRPAEFIMHWVDTYNPRKKDLKWMPFVFFKRQTELINFLHEMRLTGESGLIEKCRDAGATWISCAYSVHSWMFIESDAIGWGSRKQDLVDKIGNPDSIFEKMRLIINRLPEIWVPSHDQMFLKIINHENGSIIMGEAGDNIGRGGRTSMYFKDESAHYERPEKVEAALGDNTNTQIDISSVNGLGNVFHRRREAGLEWAPNKELDKGYTRVFIMDWRDHPEKTQTWYEQRKSKYEREGMLHIFAQEVDRNYSASVDNVIIPYEWIRISVDAHKNIRWKDDKDEIQIGFTDDQIPNIWNGSLDVADEGLDRNASCLRQWIIWRQCDEWGERDTGVTTRRLINSCRSHKGIKIQYDIIGVGSGVKSEYNRLVDDGIVTKRDIILIPWHAGAAVIDPMFHIIPDDLDSPLNMDVFANLKAQAWMSLRTRFYKTMKNITEGDLYPPDELISLDSSMPLLQQLMKELAQPTLGESTALKSIVNKKPDGTKSPNLADCGVMAYFPMPDASQPLVGGYGA